jgi:hypothetical protein
MKKDTFGLIRVSSHSRVAEWTIKKFALLVFKALLSVLCIDFDDNFSFFGD